MSQKKIITCPKCGCEYLPAEIFYPKSFLGYPSNIVRSEKGEILGYQGESPEFSERFVCEKCGSEMTVSATVVFKAEIKDSVFDQEDFLLESAD